MTALPRALFWSVSHLLTHMYGHAFTLAYLLSRHIKKNTHFPSCPFIFWFFFFVLGAYNTNTSPLGLLRACEVWRGPAAGLFPLLLAFSAVPFRQGLSTTYFYTLPTCLSCFCKQQRHPLYVNQLFCSGSKQKRWIQGKMQRWQAALHLPRLFYTRNISSNIWKKKKKCCFLAAGRLTRS